MRFALKIVQAVVGAAATAVVLLSETQMSDPGRWAAWTRDDIYLVAAVISLAFVALIVPLVEAITERSHRLRSGLTSDFQDVLMAEFQFIQEASGLAYVDLGFHAFVVRRSVRHPIRGAQVRVARLRLGNVGLDLELEWVKGKGVIGLCWSKGQDQVLNYEAWVRKHGSDTRAQWDSLEPEESYGLSYEEFHRTMTNFGSISASPLFDTKGKYMGAVTVDGPHHSFRRLSSPDVLGRLQATAQVLARLLNPMGN